MFSISAFKNGGIDYRKDAWENDAANEEKEYILGLVRTVLDGIGIMYTLMWA